MEREEYAESTFICQLQEAVEQARKNKEWKAEYMTLRMKLEEEYQEGYAEGREEGRAEGQLAAVRNLMETMNLTVEQAMAALKIPMEELEHYQELQKQA